MQDLNDPQLHSRMAKMLRDVMKTDAQSEKGKRSVQAGLQQAETAKLLADFVWNLREDKRCRYDYDNRMLYFDGNPAGSTKAEVTLRFIRPNEGEDALEYMEAVFEVVLPCSAF